MIISSYRPTVGGAERQLEGLASNLAEKGIEIVIFTRRVAGAVNLELLDGYQIRRLFSGFSKVGFAFALFFELLLHGRRFNVFHCHTLNGQAALASLAAGYILGRPVVLKVTRSGDGSQLANYRRTSRGRLLFKLISRGAEKIIALTQDVEAELLCAGVKADKIIKIPNGTEMPERVEQREVGGRLNISYIGRLIERKRVDWLVASVGILRKEYYLQLSIVGEGPERSRLKRMCDNLEDIDLVQFLGQRSREEIADILANTDIFVLPSHSEGMSNALLEAMASGVAVVAADIQANRELVLDSHNGILFNTREGLTNAIRGLAHDPAMRRDLGDAARETIEQRLSYHVISQSYQQLYESIS